MPATPTTKSPSYLPSHNERYQKVDQPDTNNQQQQQQQQQIVIRQQDVGAKVASKRTQRTPTIESSAKQQQRELR
ncbi:hypothetical protein CCHR01_16806 [Colletotrichum chrysophilum]|uniref:Uncharacterized protein n=1 Tax=Colletotrichum chrysophilum TaxID=1836956 RepID=A0AAD9ED44_9PEZI|nr:hypothetical protein CCHR01_16806 [Colletotrichum chrysophilum]